MAATSTEATARLVRCLGWCGGTFMSADPTRWRFCGKCNSRRPRDRDIARVERQSGEVATEYAEKYQRDQF